MTTKNLSRTVIEGGRTGSYKAECQKRIRQERAAWRSQALAIARDPESWEDDLPAIRDPVYPDFADKLNPIYRFLDSRIGKPWDGVRSELFARFDTRTTPGRHVLHDHLLRDVSESPDGLQYRYGFKFQSRYYRDAEGTLRSGSEWHGRSWQSSWSKNVRFDLHPVARWLGARKVGRAGAGFAQYVATVAVYGGPLRHEVRAIVERGQLVYGFVSADGVVLRRDVPPLVTLTGGSSHSRPRSS